MLANHPSKLWECWAVSWLPAPFGVRMTSGQRHLAAEHRADLRGVVDDLVHRDEQEVQRHDLDDGTLAEHRSADTGADEALLRDGGVAHAVGPELVEEAGGDLVGAVEDADLLAHDEDALVAGELLAQR